MLIDGAKLHAYRAADDIDRAAAEGGKLELLSRARVRADAGVVIQNITRAIDILLFAHGAGGFANASPLQRLWRDSAVAARHAVILPQVSFEVYGKALLGVKDQITPSSDGVPGIVPPARRSSKRGRAATGRYRKRRQGYSFMANARTCHKVITCAITGGIHTPTMSDALPVTPDDIAAQSIAAAEAGASILHLHARDPKDGRPTLDPPVFMQFLPRIKQSTDAVINITTGGGLGVTLEQRLAAPLAAKPEIWSLNMGSMNFAIFPLADRYKTWKHDWEEPSLRGTDDYIFRNTFRDIERILKRLGEEPGTRFEHECCDVGHLCNLAHFVDRKLLKPPFFVQTIFGILGGIGADISNLMFMKVTADRLFGDGYRWSVLAAGRSQIPFATQAAMMGGNVRVGLEDSLYIGRGKLAASNAEQVAKMRRIRTFDLRDFHAGQNDRHRAACCSRTSGD